MVCAQERCHDGVVRPGRLPLLALALAACSDDPSLPADELLSAQGLFLGDGHTQEPAPGVVPFDVISPLFSDHTAKHRFLAIPDGAQIGYAPRDSWSFPVGTRLVKTFGYPLDARAPSLGERLLETRILRLDADGWSVHTYAWNDTQTDAVLTVAGKRVPVEWIDENGALQSIDYRLPNTNQCLACHGERGATAPLGPRTLQLDRDHDYGDGPVNQLDHLAALGLFTSALDAAGEREHLVDPADPAAGSVELRARSYLEANCAHCHRAGAPAESSGLILGWEEQEPVNLGVCRRPFSAGNGAGGRTYDLVPGEPDASIIVYRMESTAPDIKMPEMPTQLVDARGVALIREWIAGMTPPGCE